MATGVSTIAEGLQEHLAGNILLAALVVEAQYQFLLLTTQIFGHENICFLRVPAITISPIVI